MKTLETNFIDFCVYHDGVIGASSSFLGKYLNMGREDRSELAGSAVLPGCVAPRELSSGAPRFCLGTLSAQPCWEMKTQEGVKLRAREMIEPVVLRVKDAERARQGIREEAAGGGEFKSEAGSLGCADTQTQAGEVPGPVGWDF